MREEGGWTEVVVRVHGSGRAQDGFGIQTKQGQLLLPLCVHLFEISFYP